MYEKIYAKFLNTIKKNALLEAGDHVVAGLSGGADSVCLVLLLKALSEREFDGRLYVTAAHYNHGIRGAEADRDQEFCKDFCEEADIAFVTEKGDVLKYAAENKLSCEEAARQLRYEFFDRVSVDIAEKTGMTPKIAVAHNRNDRAETVFFNIARGTSVEGLKGISYKREKVIRPILDLSRSETESLCVAKGVEFRNDSTNAENHYTRNKIRNLVLPYLNDELGVDFSESLLRLSELAAEENDFLKRIAAESFEKCVIPQKNGTVKIDGKNLAAQDSVIAKRVLRNALALVSENGVPIFKDLTGIDKKMTDRIYEYVGKNAGGGYVIASNGVICAKIGNDHYLGMKEVLFPENTVSKENCQPLTIIKKDGTSLEQRIALADDGEFFLPDGTRCIVKVKIAQGDTLNAFIEKCKKGDNSIAVFDGGSIEKLQSDVVLRTKREGDFFRPFKSKGGKPLRRFFTDCKIPLAERVNIPLIACGNEIFHVFYLRRSNFASVQESHKCAIIIWIETSKE